MKEMKRFMLAAVIILSFSLFFTIPPLIGGEKGTESESKCISCHVGTDKKRLIYFKNKKSKMFLKIGLNPNKTKDMPYNYVALRHTPADPGLFDFYVKNGLSDFDALPTWKLTAPHNIQRKTYQNEKCNNCHGNTLLFLSKNDMEKWKIKANSGVIVPEIKIPKPVKEVGQ